MLSHQINNIILDSASIEVNRRARRTKTDKLDVIKLLTMLIRYCNREYKPWRVVKVPCQEIKNSRRLHRELERLKREYVSHSNRIKKLLATQGIYIKSVYQLKARLEKMQ